VRDCRDGHARPWSGNIINVSALREHPSDDDPTAGNRYVFAEAVVCCRAWILELHKRCGGGRTGEIVNVRASQEVGPCACVGADYQTRSGNGERVAEGTYFPRGGNV